MDLVNEKEALIDKVTIYGFHVIEVADIGLLLKKRIITIKEDEPNSIILSTGEYFHSIAIDKTPLFDRFCYGVTKYGSISGALEISVGKGDGLHNLNCFTAIEYKERVIEIQKYLLDEYGIKVDFDRAKYKSMELNKTIVLEKPFRSYQRPLTLLMAILPGKLKLHALVRYSSIDKTRTSSKDIRSNTETFERTSGKKGLSVMIYDKSKQLESMYKIQTDANYLRYEITLNSSTKIKDCLGTNSVWDITDSGVNDYFTIFIRDNVEEAYKKFQERQMKEIRKVLKATHIPGSRVWIRDVLGKLSNREIVNGIPLLLDLEELLPQLELLSFNSRQIKYNAKKQFRFLCATQYTAFNQGDNRKAQELIRKLK